MNKQINVMHLSMNLPVGGSNRLLLDILNCFALNSSINNILAVMSDVIAEPYKTEIARLPKGSVYIVNNSNPVLNVKELLSIIRKKNIQIVHCDSFIAFKYSMALKTLMPWLKIAYTIHDTNLIIKFKKRSILAKKLYVDAFIAISKAVEQECKNRWLTKVYCINNGVDLSKFSAGKACPGQTPDSTLNLINVARVHLPKKGQDILIKALHECKKKGVRFKCSFIGDVDISTVDAYKQMQEEIKQLGLEEETNFLGSRNDVPDLLHNSDLFVLPSRYEGFGLVIIEAMAAGLPVVASNIDGPKEIITDGVDGLLFENENHMDLADKITELYNDRKKLTELAQAGFELSKNYDIKNMCNQYYELYKKLLKRN